MLIGNGPSSKWRSEWSKLHDVLADNGGISMLNDVDTAFTDRFIKELYQGDGLVWPGP